MTPHRCPICNGVGNVPIGFYSMRTMSAGTLPETCKACNGTGILWERKDES